MPDGCKTDWLIVLLQESKGSKCNSEVQQSSVADFVAEPGKRTVTKCTGGVHMSAPTVMPTPRRQHAPPPPLSPMQRPWPPCPSPSRTSPACAPVRRTTYAHWRLSWQGPCGWMQMQYA